jgi:hypothetical protein
MTEPEEGNFDEVYGICSDDEELRNLILNATKKRVSKKLLTKEGLYAFRYLTALLVGREDLGNLTPEGAMATVLNAMLDRIGDRRGQWLNSLAVVGKRLISEGCYGPADLGRAYKATASKRFTLPVGVAWSYDDVSDTA